MSKVEKLFKTNFWSDFFLDEIQVKQAELALKREELRLKEAVAEVAAAEKLLGSEKREDERDDAREEAQALPN